MRIFDDLNAWELGGYKGKDGKHVKHNLILRTQKLHDMSEAQLKTLVDVYHLKTVIDFRMTVEKDDYPDPVLEGVHNYHIKIIDEEQLRAHLGEEPRMNPADHGNFLEEVRMMIKNNVFADDMYIGFVEGIGKRGYEEFFRRVLETDEGALLFHCTSGKDRTGIAAMLLLGVLGVDEETIINDYLLTNTYNEPIIQKRMSLFKAQLGDDYSDDLIMMAEGVKAECMRRVIDYIKSHYGSITDYVKNELHISEEEITYLQNRYLV